MEHELKAVTNTVFRYNLIQLIGFNNAGMENQNLLTVISIQFPHSLNRPYNSHVPNLPILSTAVFLNCRATAW